MYKKYYWDISNFDTSIFIIKMNFKKSEINVFYGKIPHENYNSRVKND